MQPISPLSKAMPIQARKTDPNPCSRHPLDSHAPGGVYLCQVGDTVSCGACCGLYNVADPSRENLTAMLSARTDRFARIQRESKAILAFQAETEAMEDRHRPLAGFHHCPFLGLIGPDRACVGCLLHPLAEGNNGLDLRGLSHYGGMACRVYFCPSCHELDGRYKRMVRAVSDDWYLYGLVVTETRLLAAFFRRVERRLGDKLRPEAVAENPRAVAAIRGFLQLKLGWPFRPPTLPLANYFFNDNAHPKPAVRYPGPRGNLSVYHDIFHELGSVFHSPDQIEAAEDLVGRFVGELVSGIC